VNYGPRSILLQCYYRSPFTCFIYFLAAGEIDNLTVSWDKVLGCVVCRFHIAAGAKLSPGQVF
jgi:hypothetical protein